MEFENEYFIAIIQNYLNGQASRHELTELLHWLNSDPQNVTAFNRLCHLFEHSNGAVMPEGNAENALKKLTKRIDEFERQSPKATRRVILPGWLKIAAAVTGMVFVTSITTRYFSKPTASAIQYITAIAPPSQKCQIILPDSSIVWLNSGTQIRYSTEYGKHSRDIYLIGEAFFKVAKNKEKPFLVHASNITVKALGTSFNVKCYTSDKTIETTLLEGKVEVAQTDTTVAPLTLVPNEKASFSKQTSVMSISHYEEPVVEQIVKPRNVVVNSENKSIETEVAWKDLALAFENESFEDLAKRLERWYNYNITISDNKLKLNHYTGKFVNNETFEQVMSVIEKTTPMRYTIEHGNVYIYRKEESEIK